MSVRKRINIKCEWCGKTIEVTPSYAKRCKYCSYKCKGDAMSYKSRYTGNIPPDYYNIKKEDGVVCSYRDFINTYGASKINLIRIYPEILRLRSQGVKIEEISKRTGVDRHTIQSYITKKWQPFIFKKIENIDWLPLNGSKKLAYIIGFGIGDGHVPENFNMARFNNINIELLKIINGYLEDIFGKKQRIVEVDVGDYGKDYYHRIETDSYIGRAIAVCGIQRGNKNYGNHIPEWIKNNKDYLRFFLAGLMDAEGTISRKEKTNKCTSLKISMSDKNFMKEIRNGFQALGIKTGQITPRNISGFRKKEYTIYELRIYTEKTNREKFYDLIPLKHPVKKKNIDLIIKQYKRTWSIPDKTPANHAEESRSNREVRTLPSIDTWLPNKKYDVQDVKLKYVETYRDRKIFNEVISRFHSYKQSARFVGRRINWLIICDGKCIGTTGLGSSVMAMNDRDKYIGWNKEQRLRNLVKTANNWRFTIIPDAPKNTGSKVLSLIVKEGKKLWYEKYGDKLVLLETLVEKPHTGSVYLASGWNYIGETKGTEFKWMDKKTAIEFVDKNPNAMIKQNFMKFKENKNKNKYQVCIKDSNTKKSIFVKPLHRYWKKELKK